MYPTASIPIPNTGWQRFLNSSGGFTAAAWTTCAGRLNGCSCPPFFKRESARCPRGPASGSCLPWGSLTAALRPFERGLFAWPQAWRLILTGVGFLAAAVVWLPPAPLFRRLSRTAALALVISAAGLVGGRAHWSADLSEDRRNSFNPAEEQALRSMGEPMKITVHLSPEDSRFRDFDRNILNRLRRVIPRLTVVVADQVGAGSMGMSREDEYGWIVYEYAGRTERSTSNSEEEVLSILHDLCGQRVTPVPVQDYPGYPLVAEARQWGLWFYGVLPALALVGAWRSRKE